VKAVGTKDEGKPEVGQASSDIPALKPYWGKPAVRNFRGGDGNVGIIRSPVRAIALPDWVIAGTSTSLRILHQAVAATVRGMKTSAPSLKRAQSFCTCSKVSFRWPERNMLTALSEPNSEIKLRCVRFPCSMRNRTTETGSEAGTE
jgi:hypothetical protein